MGGDRYGAFGGIGGLAEVWFSDGTRDVGNIRCNVAIYPLF